ncbi:A24 family peptidase [Sphingosinicella sp. CPCC 101087]|uniref:prepilin peptidase n=1 Tax=Sphingosinicella sp. CPCC 101087 TaxID=2497754 RepID=UPI00101B7101|nr:A24 family peptidase [Sphingosinicella sp. CPCC 101087]
MTGAGPDILFLALGLVFGAIVGSFLATLLIRWPRGRSVVAGQSRCDSCGTPLGPRDLVPLLSYAALHGRCRRCGAGIDRRHVATELVAALLGLISLIAHPLPLAAVTLLLGLWLLLLVALDVEHHWLPDKLTLPLIPLGLLVGWAGFGPPLADRLLGAVLGWAVLAAIAAVYRHVRGREGLGGGDPKLLAALGAWLGATQLPFVLLGAGLLGLAAVLLMRLRGEAVSGSSRLPLGALMAVTAWPIWLIVAPRAGADLMPFL